jgi:hypothetical protein
MSLYANMNKRKVAGTSRSKKATGTSRSKKATQLRQDRTRSMAAAQ